MIMTKKLITLAEYNQAADRLEKLKNQIEDSIADIEIPSQLDYDDLDTVSGCVDWLEELDTDEARKKVGHMAAYVAAVSTNRFFAGWIEYLEDTESKDIGMIAGDKELLKIVKILAKAYERLK